MEQKVKFILIDDDHSMLSSVECKVDFEDDGSYDVNFFNPQTGYTSQSDPETTQIGWSYQDPNDQLNMDSLIYHIKNWRDWADNLSWIDNHTDTFTFKWSGKFICNSKLKELIKI